MTLSIITEADNLSTVSNEKALIKSVGKKTSIKTDDKKTIIELQKETVIEYLTDHVSCKSSDIAKLLYNPLRLPQLHGVFATPCR